MKKLLLGALCIGSMVILSGCTNKEVEEVTQSAETTETQVQSGDIMPPDPTVSPNPEPAVLAEKNYMEDLTAIEGYTGSGYASVNQYSDSYFHTATAELDAPAEGSVYEGWLVNAQTGEFFSTGVMKAADEGYLVEYTHEGQLDGYTKVVITEETEVDETPEAHVLEGTLR